jgi:hypothetical protein
VTRWEAFSAVCSYLRAGLLGGEPATIDDSSWELLVEASSYHFVTPALAWCLQRGQIVPPADVREYFDKILALNAKHNENLLASLTRTVRALNAIDIEPVLLKGSARLIEETYPAPTLRFVGDLDVLIPADRSAPAATALKSIGFHTIPEEENIVAPHHLTPLHDPETGAGVELHTALLGPQLGSLLATDWFYRGTRRRSLGDLTIRLADATRSVGHIVAHDQIHDFNYWERTLELRQLLDLAMIRAKSETAIDWSELDDRFCRMGLGTVFATYMAFGETLLGQPMPRLRHAALPGAMTVFRWTIERSRYQLWGNVALKAIRYIAEPRGALRLFQPGAWRDLTEGIRRIFKRNPFAW